MSSWRELVNSLVLLLLAVLWTTRFLLDKNNIAGVIGSIFFLGFLTYMVHVGTKKSYRNSHYGIFELSLTILLISIVVLSYLLTGSTLLFILSVLLTFLILFRFTISYIVPRVQGDTIAIKNLLCW